MEKKLVRILETVLGALLVGMVSLLVAQVATRYVLQGTLLWAGEMAVWLFVWITYIGMVVLYINKKHIIVDIVSTLLPDKINRVLEMISSIIVLIFLVILFKESIPIVVSYSQQTATSIAVSKTYLFSSITVASFLMIVHTIYTFVQKIRGR